MSTLTETHADIVPRLEAASERVQRAHKAAASVIFGQDVVIERTLVTILSGGHALLIGVPGLAKTLLVETLGKVLGLDAKRVQFTPDLMPSDIIGSEVLEDAPGKSRSFRLVKGPIFTQLLMADEINRASPRTQSALLQAMQEHHVTVAGTRYDIPSPFHVLATQNPLEHEGTYPLPEAQLDRFLLRTAFGYPSRDDEVEVLGRRIERQVDEIELRPVVDRETLLEMQRAVEQVHVAESIQRYCVDIVAATRESQSSAVGASPRGSLALLKLARCKAALAGRDYVLPDDVKAIGVPALAHRLVLRPELWVQRISAEDVIRDVLAGVPTPAAEDVAAAR